MYAACCYFDCWPPPAFDVSTQHLRLDIYYSRYGGPPSLSPLTSSGAWETYSAQVDTSGRGMQVIDVFLRYIGGGYRSTEGG